MPGPIIEMSHTKMDEGLDSIKINASELNRANVNYESTG